MTAERSDRKGFISYPTNRVVGSVGGAAMAEAAVAALLQAGFVREDIEVLHGDEDLRRLDPTGAEHGFPAQVQRRLIRTLDLEEFRQLSHTVDDIRAGRYVVMVLTRRRIQRILAADILHHHGADFVGFYGRWAYQELPATPQSTPEAIPALFVRAWNDRDADALASLFDEDAEFVDVSGQCWHDRESIRRAHGGGPDAVLITSKLAAGETRVKLLAPEIALVHARLTRSADDPGALPASAPRATIASFVVHRAGDRWRCAAAHATDVGAAIAPTAIEPGGVLGIGTRPGDTLA
jgi:uncharacterized protein (TIGR02246 family)